MIRIAALAAMLAVPQAAAAQQCLTRDEVAAAVTYAAPLALDSVAEKCGPSLPPDAFLRTGSAPLAGRLRAEAPGNASALGTVLSKLAGKEMPAGISPETLQLLARDLLGSEIAKAVKPADCAKVDALVSALSPLPARNIGLLGAMLMELGSSGKNKESSFSFCPDQLR